MSESTVRLHWREPGHADQVHAITFRNAPPDAAAMILQWAREGHLVVGGPVSTDCGLQLPLGPFASTEAPVTCPLCLEGDWLRNLVEHAGEPTAIEVAEREEVAA